MKGFIIGISLIAIFVFMALFAPFISPYDPTFVSENLRLPPIWSEGGVPEFILGTDDLGRDVLSRIIHGAPVSLGIGFFVVILSTFIGTFLGALAGSIGGVVDQILSRLMDIILALPSMLMAIVVVAILGPSLQNTVIAVAVVSIPAVFRLVRGSVMSEMNKTYVLASKSFGTSWARMIFINVLPNCLAPIIVQASLGFSDAILNAAALGFLGLGAQPPTAEWGTMLADSRGYIESSPWMVTLPGLCILFVVIGFNLIGDGLRDYFDPQLREMR